LRSWVERALGLIFVASALAKLTNVELFLFQVYQYSLLPKAAVEPLGLLLLWLEVCCGLGLLRACASPAPLCLSGLLYGCFSGAVGLALWRGKRPDCGCFGLESEPISSTHLVVVSLLSLFSFWLAFQKLSVVKAADDPSHTEDSE
jgi:hypothetical protein